ncbi:cutinase-domain-containing protein [Punctularia strigosozonata HHB-11173 SS5]|uniref:Cutinase-domain-containing protein n=1 Tax=Punctularia strigosozonata (strain HHB-11173) TaxID=741275 RepID=R7S4I4_PUNST|nr:cutinase-domain-containing protein [Punctularia strigosozonata HHB-11173 SS5]EIN05295.1 cutinase-domain-containing protein [Punctularia strigosozonata HHB-11173 SS5]
MAIRSASLLLLGATLAFAGQLEERQSGCPQVHVFGARETTVPPGYGTAGQVVDSILSAYPGSTAEAINYPACGGQASCGDVSYANSVLQGVQAVASQVNSFNQKCPSTFLVLVGYSQGGQIFDDAYCGGGDTNEGLTSTAIPISTSAQAQIKAAIFMGDPRHIPGLSYNVGTCQASGFAPRPAGFQCPYASNIQSYCDSSDPYCCNGNNAATHQGYANEYGAVALTFVKNKLNTAIAGSGSGGSSGTTTSPTSTAPGSGSTPPAGGSAAHWAQCGGQGFTGPTTCASPYTCQCANACKFSSHFAI